MRPAFIAFIFFCGIATASEPTAGPEFPGEARKARLKNEIADAGPSHPWAGSYYEGDGLGSNISLLIAPSGEYSLDSSGCTSFDPTEEGKARIAGGVLHFEGAESNEMAGQDFLVVPWGKRVYLISEGALVSFANAVNRGSEPRYRAHGFYLMRDGGEDHLAIGQPDVPKAIRPYLLDRPIDAVITWKGLSTVSTEPYASQAFKTEIMIDAGKREGVFPGMTMDVAGKISGEAEISTVGERTSTAMLSSYSPPEVGWKLSTRWSFMKGLSPYDQPFRINTVKSTPVVFPKSGDRPHRLFGEDDAAALLEAPKHGYAATEIARIEFSAASRELASGKIFSEKVEEVVMRLGGNAYYEDHRSSAEEGPPPWSHVRVIVAYRVERGRRLVRPEDFAEGRDGGGKYRLSWPSTLAQELLNANSYARKSRAVREAVFCEIFMLTAEQCVGWASLRFSDLRVDQREAFAKHWDSGKKSGLVRDARPENDEVWGAYYEGKVEAVLKPYQAKNPRAYAEYRRLSAIRFPQGP